MNDAERLKKDLARVGITLTPERFQIWLKGREAIRREQSFFERVYVRIFWALDDYRRFVVRTWHNAIERLKDVVAHRGLNAFDRLAPRLSERLFGPRG